MEKLNLPVIGGRLLYAGHLSMDDYLKFIEINLKLTVDRKALRKQKRQTAVNVAFVL